MVRGRGAGSGTYLAAAAAGAPLRLVPRLHCLEPTVSRSCLAVAAGPLASRHPPRKKFCGRHPVAKGSASPPNFCRVPLLDPCSSAAVGRASFWFWPKQVGSSCPAAQGDCLRTVSGNWLTNCCWALGSVATWSIWRCNLGVGPRLAAAGSSPRRCSTGTLRALAMRPRAADPYPPHLHMTHAPFSIADPRKQIPLGQSITSARWHLRRHQPRK